MTRPCPNTSDRPAALRAFVLAGVATTLLLAVVVTAPARALIAPPVTLDGPSADIGDLGGVAIASDGSGGLVYTKVVDGVPHVFAVRYVNGRWGAPLRVDWDQPFDASSPRIAAEPGGRLLVVWVTPIATYHEQIQHALVSASLAPGAQAFAPSLVVDANVGDGAGLSPSLSGASPGRAIVAYRVVTNDSTVVSLRRGDVSADIRLARLTGSTWSQIGPVNRNPAVSMRPPGPANGPEVEIGANGNGVVAWQEPDETGTARIWLRRVFGTVPGPPLEASPASWSNRPVTDDADAFSLDVTDSGQAEVAMRIEGSPGSPFGGPRVLLNTLPSNAASLTGATLNDASPASFGDVVTAVNPAGGGITAWPAVDRAGSPVAAVREDFPSGEVQTGLVAGAQAGPVSELSVGRAGSGDAIVAFRQGVAGHIEIVADRVTVPPERFALDAPAGWVRPAAARVSWEEAPSAVGGVTYGVLLDGRMIARALAGRSLLPQPAQLGDGVRSVRVLATDALGQQLLSAPVLLRVDARPPRVTVAGVRYPTPGTVMRGHRAPRRRRASRRGPALGVVVNVRDAESGVARGATRCSFGDRSRAVRGTGICRHRYRRPGRYTIVVHARDVVGNQTTRTILFEVR